MLRKVAAVANVAEKILGSSLFALICFSTLANIVVDKTGLGFFEYILAVALYINLSTKIEQTATAIRGIGEERERG